MRRLALPAAAVLLSLAAGCAAAPPVRTEPNRVERAALAEAQAPAQRDGIAVASDQWTQLWTPTQAVSLIHSCVSRVSGGVLDFEAAPLAHQSEGLRFGVGLTGSVSLPTALGEFTDRRAIRGLVDGCVAQYPIDRRLWSVPARERGSLYSYDVTVLRRCLVAHGQSVPRMPSRARFEDLLRSKTPWNAYDLVVVDDRAAWYALADACPALPPGITLD